MDPEAFLVLARRLSADGPGPAERRTAVSRAYYAAFHEGCKLLRGIQCPVREDKDGHQDLLRLLGNCGVFEVESAASELADLQGSRVAADYRLSYSDIETPGTVQFAVETATDVVEVLKKAGTEKRYRDTMLRHLQDEIHRRRLPQP